ncbi:MAG: FG-GAP repeat protein, partial [Ignavibacteriae bacterium]|nr:FG-GAP repeat protein [Ignavibacteriota bacterium]
MKKLILLVGTVILMISFMENQSASKIGSDNMEIDFHKFNCPAPATFTETVKTVSSNENEKTPGEDIDQGWYQKVMENIEKEEYNISYNEDLGAYQSPNRANNIRFIYHKDGFTAVTRDVKRETGDVRRETQDVRRETLDEWSIDFKLSDVKRQMSDVKRQMSDVSLETHGLTNLTHSTNSTDLTDRELSVAGNKASIEDENIRIDYTNDKKGMRQDFIIKKKPKGEGKLKLNISADTKLKMIVGADALMFKDKNGIDKMKYSALKVWDANGRELRAYFEDSKLKVTSYELRNKSQNGDFTSKGNSRNLKLVTCNYFSIVVNDDEAIYPITIDPLSTSPSWTAESNQAGAEFGFSVATAGDVNGDGYSDVIVGAPKYDNGETDEGRAFVFHGSATGLSSTANWTAESDQENAQLGYCVATAGDVNGDGYSDVLTGAPLYDNGQT